MKIDVCGRKIGDVWHEMIGGIMYRMEYMGNGKVSQVRTPYAVYAWITDGFTTQNLCHKYVETEDAARKFCEKLPWFVSYRCVSNKLCVFEKVR